MAKRKVKGQVKKPNDTPWGGVTIVFTLHPGSYDQQAFYPGGQTPVVTAEDGTFSTELWCNEGGVTPSVYGCTINGNNKDNFTFTLPYGTEEIDLMFLRAMGVSPFPVPPKPVLRDFRDAFTPLSGQTEFMLRQIPIHPHLSLVWLNGVKLNYATDYVLDGSKLVYKLEFPRLEDTDRLEIVYHTGVA